MTGDADTMPLAGALAPPMENGELLFESPWQGRVFGMARALCEHGYFDWDEFRDALIDEIGAWDAGDHHGETYHYYDHFLAALNTIVAAKGLLPEDAIAARDEEITNRPHGHDH